MSSISQQKEDRARSTGLTSPKAAALIIGNEVLSGKVLDTNTNPLAKLLFTRGVDLARVEIVPDVKEEIVTSLQGLHRKVGENGFVFTSGGIGPTHDDITYESVAAAFGVKLAVHQPTLEKMRVHYEAQGKEVNDARLRMATLPQGSEVLFTPGMWVPLAVLNNVYILPGIPRLFNAMLEAHKERFVGPLCHQQMLYTHQGEGQIAAALSAVAKEFENVSIGSYPATQPSQPYTVKLSFEGRDAEAVSAAVEAAQAQITCFTLPEGMTELVESSLKA